jgi:hypothetical protein
MFEKALRIPRELMALYMPPILEFFRDGSSPIVDMPSA